MLSPAASKLPTTNNAMPLPNATYAGSHAASPLSDEVPMPTIITMMNTARYVSTEIEKPPWDQSPQRAADERKAGELSQPASNQCGVLRRLPPHASPVGETHEREHILCDYPPPQAQRVGVLPTRRPRSPVR